MDELKHCDFTSRDELDAALAAEVAAQLATAIARRGEASLVVSGGSTPLQFFARLSVQQLPWEKVVITLADERWVAPDHADSNERLLREQLLVNAAQAARFVPLKTADNSAEQAEQALGEALASLPEFDVVILGMGADGHTASLFPCAEQLERGLDLESTAACIAVQPSTAAHQRMSLSLSRLLQSRQLIVHITGAEKKAVLETALREQDACKWPIYAIVGQRKVPVALYWSE